MNPVEKLALPYQCPGCARTATVQVTVTEMDTGTKTLSVSVVDEARGLLASGWPLGSTETSVDGSEPRPLSPVTHRALDMEFRRAQEKHGENTPANRFMTNAQRLTILVEEVGEVARAMTYDEGSSENLLKELTQVSTMAAAWMEGVT